MPLTIDYDVLNIDLLPVQLRTDAHIEWLTSLVKPVKTLDTALNTYYDSIIFDVTHVGQILSLEHYLNIYFGLGWNQPTFDRETVGGNINDIYITDGVWFTELYSFLRGADANSDLNNFGTVDPSDPSDGQMYTFNVSEGADSIQDTIYSYSNEEYLTDQIDFVINVPTAWWTQDNEDKIKEIVNRYKKVGKSYIIVTY